MAQASTFPIPHPALRWLFAASVVWGAAFFWVAQHPPMVDLPQHAAQVALWRDLLDGQSTWKDLVYVNLGTPYLIGYGLALPLSLILPVGAALKLLLSLAYVAFVAMCVLLRRHFAGDPRLDWLFLLGFVGFVSAWGFLTFLVATPIALALILLADRYGQQPSLGRAAAIVAVGLVALAAHGLAFVVAWGIGGILLIARAWPSLRRIALALLPHVLLGVACLLYFLRSRGLESQMSNDTGATGIIWDVNLWRFPRALVYGIGGTPEAWLVIAAVVLLSVPWLYGLRIDWRTPPRWLPFATVTGALLVIPLAAFDTYFLYHRFAIFFLPTYALMFKTPSALAGGGPAISNRRATLATAVLVLACWAVLGTHTLRSWRFDREEADFRNVLAAAVPGERALALIFNRSSDATHHSASYVHSAAWYQAEKDGFVDFNFAWFPPQIVRFKPSKTPPVMPGFEWGPEGFDWQRHRGADYRYFFVRRGPSMPADVFHGAECKPVAIADSGPWILYERRACP